MPSGTRLVRVQSWNAAVALAVAAFSCAAPATMPEPHHAGRAKLVQSGAEAIGIALGQQCTATGLETCFNARDDNCNGLVDEGCGLATGPLQIVIAWDNADADVDLEVTGPNGEQAQVGRVSAVGLTKDRDCPGDDGECGGQNFEVVTIADDELPNGRYRATLLLERPAPDSNAVHVRLGGHIGPDALSGQVELTPERPRVSVEFVR